MSPHDAKAEQNAFVDEMIQQRDDGIKRTFETGATRDTAEDKPDYEGYLSPLVLRRYGEYMLGHQTQSDGEMRASDNWQKGMPLNVYMKSLWRHLMALWTIHRCYKNMTVSKEEALCAIIFNASGYLHELLREDRDPAS